MDNTTIEILENLAACLDATGMINTPLPWLSQLPCNNLIHDSSAHGVDKSIHKIIIVSQGVLRERIKIIFNNYVRVF
jgi:hypothetical protein